MQRPPTDAESAGSGSDSGSSGPNPCEIVTAAEVQTILGAAATPKGPEEKNRGSVCTWDQGNGGSVLVQVFHGKEFYSPEMQAPKATKLAGVGDEAYLDAFGSTRVAVGFLKGDTAVFIDGMFGVTSVRRRRRRREGCRIKGLTTPPTPRHAQIEGRSTTSGSHFASRACSSARSPY